MRWNSEVDYALRGTLAAQPFSGPRNTAREMPLFPVAREDFAPVSVCRYLQSMADVVVRVYPLPTGYSKDVQGRLSVYRRPVPIVGWLAPAGAPSSTIRVDGSAVLLPAVAIPVSLTSGSASTATESWTRTLPRSSLFRVNADTSMKGVGDVGYLRP
jgi:hypothetical protein